MEIIIKRVYLITVNEKRDNGTIKVLNLTPSGCYKLLDCYIKTEVGYRK